jgi:hypothetical protein
VYYPLYHLQNLLRRGFQVAVYERAASWPEIGAAFAFKRIARECMERLDPPVLESLARVGQKSPHEKVRYWDGFHPRTKEVAEREKDSVLFEVLEKIMGFWACIRGHFLLEMAAQLPEGIVQFEKRLVDYEGNEESESVVLRFADGSTAESDVGLFPSSHILLVPNDAVLMMLIMIYNSHRMRRSSLDRPEDLHGDGKSSRKCQLLAQSHVPRYGAYVRRNQSTRDCQGPRPMSKLHIWGPMPT